MSDTMLCGECGTPIPASAKFCHSCGAAQEPELPPASPQADPSQRQSLFGPPLGQGEPPPPAAQRVEPVAPGAGELAGELAQRLQTPGVIAAATVGGIALLTCLVVGLITAVASPDKTIIGFLHRDDGVFTEALRLTVATTLATVKAGGREDFQLLPLIFGAAPFLGAAIGARMAAPSLIGMSRREAVAWSAGGAVVFAIGMLILALVANGEKSERGIDLEFSIGSVLLTSLLLAGAGAVFGALRAARTVAPDRPGVGLPPAVTGPLRTGATPLIGLAALLAVTTIVGFVHLEVQTVRGQEEAVTPYRTDLSAGIENILLAPDVGIDTAGLAVLGRFDDSVLPVDDDKRDELTESLGDDGEGRIFDYSGALPIYVFLPELLIVLGAVLAAALYAGFATARRAAPPTQLIAAGWGALTGIVWALALVILRALALGQSTIGDSVFASTLLIGTVLGAIGGVLAFRPVGTGIPPPPPGVLGH
ncbi:MAG: hypothetical protein M3401_12400 [Actinomycetota bacterium]|nr:hypothetical protein [Actinomycetota bacterium]